MDRGIITRLADVGQEWIDLAGVVVPRSVWHNLRGISYNFPYLPCSPATYFDNPIIPPT